MNKAFVALSIALCTATTACAKTLVNPIDEAIVSSDLSYIKGRLDGGEEVTAEKLGRWRELAHKKVQSAELAVERSTGNYSMQSLMPKLVIIGGIATVLSAHEKYEKAHGEFTLKDMAVWGSILATVIKGLDWANGAVNKLTKPEAAVAKLDKARAIENFFDLVPDDGLVKAA